MLSRRNACLLDILIIDKCVGNSLMSYICMQTNKKQYKFLSTVYKMHENANKENNG